MNTRPTLRRISPFLLLALLVGCQQPDPITVVITPGTVQVGTFRKHQFAASVSGTDDRAVSWSIQEGSAGGSMDDNGVYTAPAAPGTYHVIAATRATPVQKASATVKVVDAPPEVTVSIEPAHQQVRAGASVTFSAQVLGLTHPELDTSVSWSVKEDGGGTISAEGVYTAPDTPGEFHVIATSNANPLRAATARVDVRNIVVEVAPADGETGPLYVDQTRAFRATVLGTENQAVTWSVQGEGSGSVVAEGDVGVYTAPATPGTYTLLATSEADPESIGTLEVRVESAPALTVTIKDGAREVNTLETLQFEAEVTNAQQTGLVWSVKAGGVGGTIDAQTGLYTAPGTHGTDTIVATSVEDSAKSAEVRVTVRPFIIDVSPMTSDLLVGETLELTVRVQNATNTSVQWTLANDADSADGTLTAGSTPDKIVYTAPSSPGSDTVRVTSQHDPSRYAEATLTVRAPPPVTVTVAPATITLLPGTSVDLTATVTNDSANLGVVWRITEAGAGSLTPNGLTARYTAPATPGQYHVVASSVADPTRTATATITVEQAVQYDVAVSPMSPVTANPGQTVQFSAVVGHTPNTGVTWSVSPGGAGGTIDQTGLYTAPATVGSGLDTVVATSNDDSNKRAQVQVTVASTAVVEATPATHEMVVGGTVALSATVTGAVTQTVTWSVPAGNGSLSTTSGLSTVYTAPATPGTYTVTVASDEDPSKTDTVALTVRGWVTSGLHVHYQADELGFATGTAGEVSEWQDRSGNAYNLVSPPFDSAKPVLVPNAVNGHSAVRFDGNNDYLKTGDIPATSQPTTIFIVHNTDTTNGNATLIDAPRKPDGTGGFIAHNERNRIQVTRSGTTDLCGQIYTTNFGGIGSVCKPRAVFQSIMGLFSGTGSRLRLNGEESTMATTPPVTTGMRGVQLGLKQDLSANGSAAAPSPTEIAEVLVYDRGLSQAEIDQVETYLRVKYALPAPAQP